MTFTLYLPAVAKPAVLRSKEETSQLLMSSARILVMDDDEMVFQVVDEMLSYLGHQVIQAQDGDECIRLYEEHTHRQEPIDVVIMVLTIPGGRGGLKPFLNSCILILRLRSLFPVVTQTT